MKQLAHARGVTWESGAQPTRKHIWFELRDPLAE
jgi:hypothetical protein